jgi:hypothetical protein
VGSAIGQSKTEATRSNVVTKKTTLQKLTPEQVAQQNQKAVSKMENSQRLDTEGANKPVKMTNEYIDAEIAKLQEVIDSNKDNAEFNPQGYLSRIKYLESRRPKN